MYGVPFRNMHKAPLVWDPRHPWRMRESVDNFIKTMYTFNYSKSIIFSCMIMLTIVSHQLPPYVSTSGILYLIASNIFG